jgi:sortase A
MTVLEGAELEPPVARPPSAPGLVPAAGDAGPDGGPDGGPPPKAAAPRRPVVRAVGLGLSLLGVLVLGFAAYLYVLSGVQEARSQATLYERLAGELGNGVGPTGPTKPGAPVAILNIPSIAVHDLVVVEGTSPENLTLGPGHLRNTTLPGQGGISVIYGRRATFGAPFSRLPQLRPGARITVITSQGTSAYTVRALGDSQRLVENPAPNQLILLTAGSSTIPTYYVDIDANLTSKAQPSPGGLPDITTRETALGSDGAALVLTTLWAFALVLVSAGGTVAAVRWSPWLVYLSAVPVALAVLWNLYENLAALLPNVY